MHARFAAPIVLGVLVETLLVGCGGAQVPSEPAGEPIGTFTMTDAGCAYVGAAEARSGPVMIGLDNQSSAQFDADLWRLQEGHGFDELAAHAAEEQRRSREALPPLGHPSFATLVAEQSVTIQRGSVTAYLSPGTYGLACIRFVDEVPVDIWAAGPFSIR